MDNKEDDEAPTLLSHDLSNTQDEGENVIADELPQEGEKAVDDIGLGIDYVASGKTEAAVVVSEEREVSDSVTEVEPIEGDEIFEEDKVTSAIDEAENVIQNQRVEEGTEVGDVESGKAEEEEDDADVGYDDSADEADVEIGHSQGTDDVIRDEKEVPNEEQEEEKELSVHEGDNDGVGDDTTQDTDTAALMEEGEGEEEAGDGDGDGVAQDIEEEEEQGGGGDGMEEDDEVREEQSESVSGGKRKRGPAKNSKTTRRVASKKKTEEDVCFICFDGGDLVLCNRRGCPKAYHPSCVNRDEAFFRTKGKWNCGWHLCSNCEKNAHYMCYTCTFSLCKGCIKDAIIFCVRGNKGFCETCMTTVMLIEQNEQGNTGQVDFDDKNSWEYLFKDYYIDLKEKLSLTFDELTEAKNPWKGSDMAASKDESPDELYDANNDKGSDSDNSYENVGSSRSKRRKGKKRAKSRSKEGNSYAATVLAADVTSADDRSEWSSKELLEFVMHMRNGDTSILSQFDVQALLLEYIKRNKLRDPCRKSQIICDARLQNLFGKPRVGHFEMLKLLESHFLLKEDYQGEDLQGSVVDTDVTHLDGDGNSDSYLKAGKDKRRKTRKKGDERGLHSNVDDYAAIDNHNINLIYLRRNLVEDLLEDTENFPDKAVGSFVRIRISGSGQKQDLYRLVQVAGTCKAAEPYKVGKRMTDILLEILNLNKTEIVSIDIISNQEFTEDECKRLRQSIKCGLINRLTVGNIQDKAFALQAVRVKDWLETEIVRLSHLRDRASEKGRRKELRECVEKLQLLKTPEERQRRLEEVPEIHVDPKMDPSYESEEDEDEMNDKGQESYMRPRGSAAFGRKAREIVSPRSGSSDSWSGTRNYSNANRELNRNLSNKGFSMKGDDVFNSSEALNDAQLRDRESQLSNSRERQRLSSSSEIGVKNAQPLVASESFSNAVLEPSAAPSSAGIASPTVKINESEKMWHYQDPSGKVQGPFSMVQLRKWNNTGYFPADLRIWRTTEKQDESMPLKDALDGKFSKESPVVDKTLPKAQMVHDLHNSSSYLGKSHLAAQQGIIEGQVGARPTFDQNSGSWNSSHSSLGSLGQTTGGSRPSPLVVEVPKTTSDGWGSNVGVRNESTNLPSPTPQTPSVGTMVQGFENNWSPTPILGNPNLSGPGGLQNAENGLSSRTVMMSASTTQVHPQATTLAPGLQNQVVSSHNSHAGAQGWGSGLVSKVEPQALGATPSQRVEPNNHATMPVQNSASFITGNPTGNFPAQSYPGQSNISAPAPPNNMPWNMGVVQNQNATAWGGMPGNQNTSRGGGAVPANVNMNWMPAPGNANPGWAAAPSQGPPPPVNAAGWVAPGQGRPHVNSNMGWGQGHAPGNANPGWPASVGNQGTQGTWGGGEHNHNGDRLGNQRDRGTHGGRDSGYGGKPWSRQTPFNSGGSRGGGSSRPPFGGQRVACKFNESGRCKKGDSCDFMHT
ncbi:PREDICTED: zinc finger CCCH domain-containing protein 19 isoform X2 [Lupinus angustifolius]|uniref:zinc finger CCCH domain-containing protein 19 isoform X2 n=1 Tax=Lupinus angustifolius TaxID=3871 RepID=UPI00092F6306|nr:PREDICTED: zinc finger CCCH domain-containing protein 19 isoform X2 [Lupinus angustifolius]